MDININFEVQSAHIVNNLFKIAGYETTETEFQIKSNGNAANKNMSIKIKFY